jgi:uncharacterized membrane protein
MSLNRTREGWSVEPGGPGFPKTTPEVIAYIVFRIANLIEDVIRSTSQLVRSIILLWSMVVPVVVVMLVGDHVGIHINDYAWYAQWGTWVTVGVSGTLTIAVKALRSWWLRRKARGRRKAQGRAPPVRTTAGRPDHATPDNDAGPDRKGTPREG